MKGIKKIRMSNGEFVLIDEEDYSKVSKFNWWFRKPIKNRYTGYAVCSLSPHKIYMHRFIMNAPKGTQIDHINGNGLDNRKSNLRYCTTQENLRNRIKSDKTTTSKYKGVSWAKKSNKWEVCLYRNKKTIHLGFFENERHAALFYDLWAIDIYKEFARTNFKVICHS